MGKYIFDQYFLLHFASGVIAYFWGLPFKYWFMIHLFFEYIENTQFGMNTISKTFKMWPGGKNKPDFIINRIGDQMGACFGWYAAYYLDNYGNKKGWYDKHIK